jgi:hypothetical protein
MADANSGWVKCTDDIWRRPDDYPGQQLPVPPLAVQTVRDWPDHPTYKEPGPYAT